MWEKDNLEADALAKSEWDAVNWVDAEKDMQKVDTMQAWADQRQHLESTVATSSERQQAALLGAEAAWSTINEQDVVDFSTSAEAAQQDRSGTEKATDWFKKNKKAIWRVAWIWAWVLLFSLFRKKKKKKSQSSEDTWNNSEEKKSWFWNTVKWGLGISTGYYLVHGFVTGKWHLKDFFNREWRLDTKKPKDLATWFNTEVPEALRPYYNETWTMVNASMKELGSEWELWKMKDEKGTEVTMPVWAVPAKLDEAYGSVWDIIDNDNYITDYRRNKKDNLLWFIGGIPTSAMWLLKSGIWLVKWLSADMWDGSGNTNEKFKQRAQQHDPERDLQLERLMQQYEFVKTFLWNKREALREKYALQVLQAKDPWATITKDDIEEYLDNDDNAALIDRQVAAAFTSKKIVWTDYETSALKIIKEELGDYKSLAEEEMEEVKKKVLDNKKKVLGEWDPLEKALQSPSEQIDATLVAELLWVSTRFQEHLDSEFLEQNLIEQFCAFTGMDFDEIRNGENNDIRKAMKAQWFAKFLEEAKTANAEFMLKLQQWKATKTDVKAFKSVFDEYFTAEVNILQSANRHNTDDEREGWNFWRRWKWRLQGFVEFVQTPRWIGMVIWWWVALKVIWLKNITRVGWKALRLVTVPITATAWFIAEKIIRRSGVDASNSKVYKWLKLKAYPETGKGYSRFLDDFKAGKISTKEADVILNARWWTREWVIKNVDELIKTKLWIYDDVDKTLVHYYGGRRDMMKLFLWTEQRTVLKNIKEFETKFESILDPDKKQFIDDFFRKEGLFTKADDIKKFTSIIDDIDMNTIKMASDREALLKWLSKEFHAISDGAAFNKKAKSLIDGMSTTVDGWKDVVKLWLSADEIKVHTKIVDQVKAIEKSITSSSSEVTKALHNAEIASLKNFAGKLKGRPVQEVEALLEITTKGIRMSKMVRLVEAGVDMKAFATVLKIAEWEQTLAQLAPDLVKALKAEGQLAHYVSEMNVIRKDAQLLMKLEWLSGDILKVLKTIK